jgi:CheY-like chemotaxis protein
MQLWGRHVLVVDDNATNRAILDRLLRSWGMFSESAPSSGLALGRLLEQQEREPFALALLDLQMPDMDGLQLARAIRAEPRLRDLPLLLLASTSMHGRAEELRREGFSAWLTKPVRAQQLQDAMVRVLLPAKPDETSRGERPSLATTEPDLPALPPLRVLVAEDNSVNQKVAQRMLATLGARADMVGNGAEAVEAVMRVPYDVVLMDVQMPEMDGFEATAEIRRLEQGTGRHLPVIAMTAHAMAGDRERCLAAGMDDYLSKPIRAQSLAAALLGCTVGREVAAEPGTDGVFEAEAEFDLERLAEASSGDPEFGVSLIIEFLSAAPELLSEALGAADDGNLAHVERAAHALAGGSAMLGATGLARTAEKLRQCAESGDRFGTHALLGQAKRDLDSLQVRFEPPLHSRKAA